MKISKIITTAILAAIFGCSDPNNKDPRFLEASDIFAKASVKAQLEQKVEERKMEYYRLQFAKLGKNNLDSLLIYANWFSMLVDANGPYVLPGEKTPAELAAEKNASIKADIETELQSFNGPFDSSPYTGSVESVQNELSVFRTWKDIINQGEISDDKQLVELAKKLRAKVVKLQISEFPKMRSRYIDLVAKKLWLENITVTASGKGKTTVNFVGGAFASNKNIQETQDAINSVLSELRFKRTTYRWYSGEDEYTYYTIDSAKDSELVY